jgi:hypothetical protein
MDSLKYPSPVLVSAVEASFEAVGAAPTDMKIQKESRQESPQELSPVFIEKKATVKVQIMSASVCPTDPAELAQCDSCQ